MTNLIVAFRNFAEAPNQKNYLQSSLWPNNLHFPYVPTSSFAFMPLIFHEIWKLPFLMCYLRTLQITEIIERG